jgi:hypothetical protein
MDRAMAMPPRVSTDVRTTSMAETLHFMVLRQKGKPLNHFIRSGRPGNLYEHKYRARGESKARASMGQG